MNARSEVLQTLALGLVAVTLYVCGRLILTHAMPFGGSPTVEGLLGIGASIGGILVAGWWMAALTLAFLSEGLRRSGHSWGARLAGAFSPAFMRRLAAAVLGLHLAGTSAALPVGALGPDSGSAPRDTSYPAAVYVDSLPATPGPTADPADDHLVSPQWRPAPVPVDSKLLLRGPTRSPSTNTLRASADQIVVNLGDSLWSIVATQLGPFATDIEIAAAWPLWHSENRQVIGDDPNLLLPGQVLRVPGISR